MLVNSDDSKHEKNVCFETVKNIAIGTIIAVSAGALSSALGRSWEAKKLISPTLNELNTLLNDKTTLAVGGAFGYFGFRDAVRHNREAAAPNSSSDGKSRGFAEFIKAGRDYDASHPDEAAAARAYFLMQGNLNNSL